MPGNVTMLTLEEYKKKRREEWKRNQSKLDRFGRGIICMFFGFLTSPLLLIFYLVFAVFCVPVGARMGDAECGAGIAFLAGAVCWVLLLRRICKSVDAGEEKDRDRWYTRDWYELLEKQREHEDRERQKELLRRAASIEQELREHNRLLERLEKSPFIRSR